MRSTPPASSPDDSLLTAPTLFTGFPGFLATRQLLELFGAVRARSPEHPLPPVYLLILPATRAHAERTRALVLNAFPDALLHLVEGDVASPQLGMDAQTYARLTDAVRVVWHFAALYDLSVPRRTAYRVNVGGTQRVLRFARDCGPDFLRLNYISTCYVAGQRAGTIYEDELDTKQGHKNFYEETKFWAEVEVQSQRDEIPSVILRPGIVVGDSQTGYTPKYDGPYYVFDFIRRLPSWFPMAHLGQGNAPVNLIPVDFATQAMLSIAANPAATGLTFHIADPSPMHAKDVLSLALEAMGRTRHTSSVPSAWARKALSVQRIKQLVDIPKEALDYFTHAAAFDTANTRAFLAESGLTCPHLSTYLPLLVHMQMQHPDPDPGYARHAFTGLSGPHAPPEEYPQVPTA